jgi:hypothetical protein
MTATFRVAIQIKVTKEGDTLQSADSHLVENHSTMDTRSQAIYEKFGKYF